MNLQQYAGISLILGFIFILAASIVGPPRLYQEPESETRLEIIAHYPARWVVSNIFFALGGLITASGLLLFSLQIWGNANAWLISLSAVAYVLGTIAWVIFLYRRTINSSSLFTSYAFSPLTVALIGFIVIGLLLYGIVFLQTGYPGWLGVVTIVGMALIGGAALFFPSQFFASFPPQVIYLVTFVAGIVILRQ